MNHYRQTDAMMTMDNFGENLVVAILCVCAFYRALPVAARSSRSRSGRSSPVLRVGQCTAVQERKGVATPLTDYICFLFSLLEKNLPLVLDTLFLLLVFCCLPAV